MIRQQRAIQMVCDRFRQLAKPEGGQTSPVVDGADLKTWMGLAGVGSGASMHQVISMQWPSPADLGPHNPDMVAQEAMRHLVSGGVVDVAGGLWRPRSG